MNYILKKIPLVSVYLQEDHNQIEEVEQTLSQEIKVGYVRTNEVTSALLELLSQLKTFLRSV